MEAASVLRFQEGSLGASAHFVLVDVINVIIVHNRSVAFLCEFLLHARDETLIPGMGWRRRRRQRERETFRFLQFSFRRLM